MLQHTDFHIAHVLAAVDEMRIPVNYVEEQAEGKAFVGSEV